MVVMLEIRLLGAFEVRSGGTPVAMSSLRAQALLACLALRGGAPRRRDQVAYLLWPDSAEQQARTNLRHVLHTLRASIPDADRHVHATAQTLSLRDFSADVTAFDAALAGSGRDGADEVARLRQAADLYGGDLLAGWYDEWLITEREQYRQRAIAALARLVPLLEGR